MKSQTIERVTMSRPKDRSLDAFKAWIMDIAGRLTTAKDGVRLTEAEWAEFWKDFWKEKHKE